MARLHHPEIVVFDLDSDDLTKPSVREFAASIQQQRGTLVILGNPALESNFPVGEFIAKPYHYKPLVLKIEELLRKRFLPRGGIACVFCLLGGSFVASLFVIQGRDQGVRYELDARGEALYLGRDAGNRVQLHDTEVSRRHAEIRRLGEKYLIVDLGSSNGTFVNNGRVDQKELASGDQVQVGRTVMLFTGSRRQRAAEHRRAIDIVTRRPARRIADRAIARRSRRGATLLTPAIDVAENPWLARARSNLQIMYRTALAVSHTLDIDQLLSRIMQLIFEWVEADRGCIMLVDPETEAARCPRCAAIASGRVRSEKMTISQTILDYVVAAQGRRAHQRRPRRRALGRGRQHLAAGRSRGDLRADAGPLRRGRRHLHRHARCRRIACTQQGPREQVHEEHLKLMVAIAHQAALGGRRHDLLQAMVQAERLAAVGQTIAMLSHHIKNILQGIRGGSYLIEMGLTEHDETMVRKGWNIVEKNQNKISTLVMDMLTFSKEREPDLARGRSQPVVERRGRTDASPGRRIEASKLVAPRTSAARLQCDSEAMHRAVLNVVTNAIDACDGARTAGVGSHDALLARKGLALTSSSTTTASALTPSNCRKSSRCLSPTKGLAARAWGCR